MQTAVIFLGKIELQPTDKYWSGDVLPSYGRGPMLEQPAPEGLCRGPTLEQFVKKCNPWEGFTLEKLVEDCVLWDGPHAGASKECGVLPLRRKEQERKCGMN